jgi:ketosteroid isomerase-like protein
MSQTSVSRENAVAFVDAYGRTWESGDVPGFVDLFSEEVVYVAHATEETVVGRAALASYLRKEDAEQGEVRVRMGNPVIDGNHLAAEFWVTATNAGREATIVGGFVAQLGRDGRCSSFREYWFDVEGHKGPYQGWGE